MGKLPDMPKSPEELLFSFAQGEAFAAFLDEPGFLCKMMFGGLACYLDGRLVAVLVESDIQKTEWKDKVFPIPLWRGLLLPTEFGHHEALMEKIPSAVPHPVLKKWLYLSLDSEAYEEGQRTWIRLMRRRDDRVGVEPKPKPKRTRKRKKPLR